MDYTQLGRTGLKVSRLCLGTMNFGPATNEADSFAIMDKALELGINFFDTANVYGWRTGEGVTERLAKDYPRLRKAQASMSPTSVRALLKRLAAMHPRSRAMPTMSRERLRSVPAGWRGRRNPARGTRSAGWCRSSH